MQNPPTPGLIEIGLTGHGDWMALQRTLVMMGGWGARLRQAEAGVRLTLAQHRKAQRIAGKPYYREGSPLYLSPAVTRQWVLARTATVRRVKADIETEVQRFAPPARQAHRVAA